MNFKRLREQLERYAINELSPELKNKVIDARKKQLADLEKQTNKETKNLNKKLADKEQEKAKNMKHKISFEGRLYKPVPICKINGSLAQWEFYYPDKGYHQDQLCFKMTGMPVFSDTHGYPYFTGTREGYTESVKTYFTPDYLKDYYEYLLRYLQNNLNEINSIEIIEDQLRGLFYKKFGYHIENLKKAQEFLQKCPDLPNYASKNEAYEINEISNEVVRTALDKTNKNLKQNKDDIDSINKEKEAHLKDSEEKLNKLRNKINDLEGMRDKKDVEQRKQRRNYTQASYIGPEQDETVAKKKLRAMKNDLPRQYGDCSYSLRTEDDLLLRYNPSEKVIEVWSNRYGDGYEFDYWDNYYGDIQEQYEYDFNKSTLENVLEIIEDACEDTVEITNDDCIDTYDNSARVSGVKVLWRDFNNLDLEDGKTYNLACFKLRYYSEERYHFF